MPHPESPWSGRGGWSGGFGRWYDADGAPLPAPEPGSPAAEAEQHRARVARRLTLWVPVVVSFVVQVPAALFRWRPREWFTGAVDDPVQFAARLALAVVGALALLFARRFPGPTFAVVSASAGAYVLVTAGESAPPFIALAFAIVGAVVRGARLWAWCSLGAAWLVTLVLGIALRVPWQPALVVAVSLALVLCVAVGESVRTRRRRFAEARRLAAERRATEAQAERVRIARELHDVLAHSLSAISVQAGVGLHLIDSKPEEAAKALAVIKATSRSALDEVRAVLGVLRDGSPDAPAARDGDTHAPLVPEPDLSRLPSLIESVRAQGVSVELDDRLTAAEAQAVPQSVQLAVFRIVQESLTNVLRHARTPHARVALSATADSYRVDVVDGPDRGADHDPDAGIDRQHHQDDPADRASAASAGSGRGLLGMRERTLLLGGTFSAAPVTGGFRVSATFPRASAPPAADAPRASAPPTATVPPAAATAPPSSPGATP
ncbi:histidine kinase [Herbiconiux moechotypicola]|uniref:histidine kinase n=1 Tax=Herbiconiux moechotypicola TaxID=637393 RepID=A0ABN3DXY0_9MICO|nr:histidine kinase [Herbiconiux moechotypicola]MCS5730863.1 histidine kinase [Herbiconiux moechotypicola]